MKKCCTAAMAALLAVTVFAGCYSVEEKEQAKAYEEQGTVNAVNYIKEKYGFEADVIEAECERVGDFDPVLGETVFVTMEWDDKMFTVQIDGDCETTEGLDNYQQEEIIAALKQELEDVTGIASEEVFAVFGAVRKVAPIKFNKNGLVTPYFDGTNLIEVLKDGRHSPSVVVSYINRDIETIDVEAVKKAVGIETLLFVDYDSREHYETITQPWYNAEGTPIDHDIEPHIPYINEYLTSDGKEAVYTNCEKKTVDGILFVTENREENVTAEKKTWLFGENEETDYKRVFDVYRLETDSDTVRICIPTELLGDMGKTKPVVMAKSNGESVGIYYNDLTDDGKYLSASAYTKDCEGTIEFSVYVREE